MSQVASSVSVDVKTAYIEAQSSPDEKKYLFSYTITISNLSDEEITLKSRHWCITDANGRKSEVHGAGVVGETPTIKPNSSYEYTSGTVLETPLGVMEGRYTMVDSGGNEFEAPISAFRLSTPGLLH
ncbi:Co2+/Mg2+ efflux protein ApaG [Shewanella schlegeliana]|uniref:Protein ApaG n=1 Tax=Shewanella schlegeliana TaxID=190308 RepID=A0ABS1SYI3_9GAMM|nr:Co2+/Mg2+ efflux protein ApaG [Shewanella schlegeliana]MBL4912351.1 Co2+/Mg2+ efflux protein ApaG [Shewanella schlegeliana]MCL1108180.1 Co2+/Mg2+ efflux protein ApaG [Shewanella schlegeliana]GIU22085.1 protein ApaG [Shewanella schlegeliana]